MASDNKVVSFFINATPEEKVEILFKKYYSSLCQGVYNILKDREIAEDVVQEVFLKIWDKRSTLELHENFFFYLKKSCYNAALNIISATKINTISTEKLEVTGYSDANEGVLHEELDYHVKKAIAQLPEKTRLVFTLSRYEEMSYKQIAEELGVSLKAVEKHMGIALSRLRESLKDYLHVLLMVLLAGL